jgi:hypothetical protein
MPLNRLHAPLRSAIVFAMVLALWFASTLGQMHGMLHGHGTLPATALPADSSAAHGAGKLFDGHADGDNQCRLYDQLSGGHALPGLPPLVLPISLPTASFHFFLGEALARWVALFDARGPPATR